MQRNCRRSLERSIPLYIALIIALFNLIPIAIASLLVFSSFSAFERADLEGRRDQFRILMARERAALQSIAKSFAEWNDSYDYFASRDNGYAEANYGQGWRDSENVNAVAFVSSDGELLWSSAEMPSLNRLMRKGSVPYRDPLLFPADFGRLPPAPVSGFAVFGSEPVFYVSWPVTDDLCTLPPRGLLVIARVLSPSLLEAFSPGDGFDVSFLPEGAAVEPASVENAVTEREAVMDPAGRAIGYWSYRKARTWTSAAMSLVAWFSCLGFAAGVGAYLLASLTVKRRMVRPILAIRDHLDNFSVSFVSESRLKSVHSDEIGELAQHVNALVERVESQTKELDRLACTDGLTGLPNRRSLDAKLADLEVKARIGFAKTDERSAGKRGSIACGLIDIDFFKNYNDIYGHIEGDETLRRIAGAIRQGAMRPADLPSRYGGEEFAVVLPDTDEKGALAVLERIRSAVEALGIKHSGSSVAPVVTISAGVAAIVSPGENAHMAELLARADKALYAAKDGGRNRVVMASSVVSEA